jgi:putative heme-binding domain-containing protein
MRHATTRLLLTTLACVLGAGFLGAVPVVDPALDDAKGVPKWIWLGTEAKDEQRVFFRRIVEIPENVEKATITASCDNRMVVYVNGQAVLRSDNWESPARANIEKSLKKGLNLIAVDARNDGGPGGLVAELRVQLSSGKELSIGTDTDWWVSDTRTERWKEIDFEPEAWHAASVVAALGAGPWASQVDERSLTNAVAPREPEATPAEQCKVLPGFRVELLFSVPREQFGSWVSLCVDPKGRIIAGDQYGSIYRFTPPASGEKLDPAKIERIELDIGGAHGLLWAFDSLYVVRGEGNQGLYRVRDTNGDDRLDDVKLLRSLKGGGEHGPHSVILAPDGLSLYVCAGNHTDPTEFDRSLVPQVWQEDHIVGRQWDAGGHAHGRMAPGGWIARTDPDGKSWELVSIGYRNEFDIAFNANGDLFTYDSDMEWDIGAPWYRPTRVNHAASGSEFGWRSGTGKWPVYYPDSLGSVVDVGPGSPTGITFGYGLRFPEKYQKALFISDWSYGKLYATHLEPDGATYKGTLEQFFAASPLPLTDLVVRPQDGALYVAVGGRRVQSGLYRLSHVDSPAVIAQAPRYTPEQSLRRELEALHGSRRANAIEKAWPSLSHADRSVRFAARVAVEHQPVDGWRDRALAETHPIATIEAIIALARCGKPEDFAAAIDRLGSVDFASLDTFGKLALLRAYGLVFVRLGPGDEARRALVARRFNAFYPAGHYDLDRELSQILVHVGAPGVIAKTVALLERVATQAEQLHYAFVLRNVEKGWTSEERRRYFEWFQGAQGYRGGNSFTGFVRNVRNEAASHLSEKEKTELASVLEDKSAELLAELPKPKGPGREWSLDSLLPLVERGLSGRNFEHGKTMFAAARCFACHRFDGQGGSVGPDLTGVQGRFGVRDLLEALTDPSKTVSDQYQATDFVLSNGSVISGRVVNLAGDSWMVMTDMLDPNRQARVAERQVVSRTPSETSLMPAGLLDALNEEEVLDLLAYLLSGGNPKAASFEK